MELDWSDLTAHVPCPRVQRRLFLPHRTGRMHPQNVPWGFDDIRGVIEAGRIP